MTETRRDFVKMVGGIVAAAGVLNSETRSANAQEQSRSIAAGKEFRAGDKIPMSGLYDVIHDRIDGQAHAADHQLTLTADRRFPNCKVCQGWVKFRLHQTVEHVTYF